MSSNQYFFFNFVFFSLCRTFVQDKERKKEIWAVNFNHFVKPGQPNIFAAVGGPRFWIYEATVHGKINLLMCYEDPDVSFFFKYLSYMLLLLYRFNISLRPFVFSRKRTSGRAVGH